MHQVLQLHTTIKQEKKKQGATRQEHARGKLMAKSGIRSSYS